MSNTVSVLITGASSGIGYATAVDLADEGHQVFAGVRRQEDADRLQKLSEKIIPVILDVTRPEHIAAAFEQISTLRKKKRPFCLINNAGVAVFGPVETVSIDDFRAQFEVNFFGLVAVTQTFLPWIRESKGRIINISSIAGRLASPFLGPYAASKFAVEGLTDSLRRELMPFGVKTILVEPGPIETPIWDKGLETKSDKLKEMNAEVVKSYQKYLNVFEEEVKKVAETAEPVGFVVDTIKHALFSYSPRHRYLVGRQARIGGMLAQFVPSKALDMVMSKRASMQMK